MSTATSKLLRLPQHWRTVRLKYVTEKIGSGKTPSGGADSYVPVGVPFIRSQNVRYDGLSLIDVVFIDESTDESMAGSRIQPQGNRTSISQQIQQNLFEELFVPARSQPRRGYTPFPFHLFQHG
jgi:hypothetical protein